MMVRSKDLMSDMEKMRDEVSNLLDVPLSAASGLLRYVRWNKEKLLEDYMNDQEKMQKDAGVYSRCNPSSPCGKLKRKHLCTICYDEVQSSDMIAMPCKHEFCRDCWGMFLKVMLEECVNKSCPQVNCNEMISEAEVKEATPHRYESYEHLQLKHFIESNQTLQCCPGADCDRVATFSSGAFFLGNELNASITCEACETEFCVSCVGEPHPSLTCKLLKAWMVKIKDPAESENWILQNTKACPNCKVNIEKNQGCNHMTCGKCKHQFCWKCLKNWCGHVCTGHTILSNHGESEESRTYLKTFSSYSEHNKAQAFAQKGLDEISAAIDLEDKYDIDFVTLKDANRLVLKCRRVLKYTFIQAYYMPLDDLKALRFEDLQQTLEKHTDMLQGLTEKPQEDIFSNMGNLRNQVRKFCLCYPYLVPTF